MEQTIVSISGSDNCGKSTQLKLLGEKYPNLFSRPLHITEFPSYPKNVNPLEFSKWWFTKDNAQEMVAIMIKCMKERYEYSKSCTKPIILFDRDDESYINKTLSALLVMGFNINDAKSIISETREKYSYQILSPENIKLYIKTESTHNAIKPEENQYSNDPALYSRHLIITSVLNRHSIKTGYIIIPYKDGAIEETNNQILNVIKPNIRSIPNDKFTK